MKPAFLTFLLLVILSLAASGCVTTAARVGTGIAAGASTATVSHH